MRLGLERLRRRGMRLGAGRRERGDVGGVDAAGPSMDQWLDMVLRLARLPAGVARDVRDELEGHLLDRVHDLEVAGLDEQRAAARAIAELGDAARVAAGFRSAHRRTRSKAMQAAMIVLCGSAVIAGAAALVHRSAALTAPAAVPVSVFEPAGSEGPAVAMRAEPGPEDPRREVERVSGDFKKAALGDALSAIVSQCRGNICVNWGALERAGLGRDSEVGATFKDVSLATALRMMSGGEDECEDALDLRRVDGMTKIATRRYFDRQERQLASYDLGALAARGVEPAVLLGALREMVYPAGWTENGGEMASGHLLGDRLFVDAPRRYHAKIRWIVAQFPAEVAGSRGSSAAPALVGVEHGAGGVPVLKDVPVLGNLFTKPATGELMAPPPVEAGPGALPGGGVAPVGPALVPRGGLLPAPVPVRPAGAAAGAAVETAPEGEKARAYLDGEVGRPGVYEMPAGCGLSLKRLITAAGGLKSGAKTVTVMRGGKGTEDEVVHTFLAGQVQEAGGPDPLVRNQDRVVVR